MIHAKGIITGGGFETPAEALYLGKKIMVIPIKGQYEQDCNAAALKEFGAEVINEIDINFGAAVDRFFHESRETAPRYFQDSTNEEIVDQFMSIAIQALNTHRNQVLSDHKIQLQKTHQETPLPEATAFDGLMNTNFPSASSAINIMP
jgi:predicted glycosyltransferase